ncbi:hypothetical protein RvY_03054-1 [Ramazzottius varieornatus]|uniref:Uncharacterized protein n=1 Tax=Ramazzottius varieornatus TaxID=947166 RepID=A0A1D1UWY8_RAMVA|nr:hypothetical protein RvY_03054-1 [Ramazzottius varieornatus]
MVEHIRHRPDSRFVLRKSSQKTRNHYGSEYDAQLTKEQDFMNIEERPTSSQYLLWINHMARQSLDFPRLEKLAGRRRIGDGSMGDFCAGGIWMARKNFASRKPTSSSIMFNADGGHRLLWSALPTYHAQRRFRSFLLLRLREVHRRRTKTAALSRPFPLSSLPEHGHLLVRSLPRQ